MWKSKTVKNMLRILVSGGLLFVLLARLDWERLFLLVAEGQWRFLGFAGVCTVLSLVFSVLRWQVVLEDIGLKVSQWETFYIVLSGFFFNQFLPSTVGGDGYRFLALSQRYSQRRSDILSSLLLDRGYGFVALIGVHLALLPFLVPFVSRHAFLVLVESGVVLGSILLGLGISVTKWRVLHKRLERLPGSVRPWVEKICRLFDTLSKRSYRMVFWALVLSAAFVICNGMALIFFLHVVGITPPWWVVLFASSLAAIVGMIPVSVNGLGLVEGILVMVLVPWGWSQEGVLLAVFLLRAVNMLEAVIGGGVYMIRALEDKLST